MAKSEVDRLKARIRRMGRVVKIARQIASDPQIPLLPPKIQRTLNRLLDELDQPETDE